MFFVGIEEVIGGMKGFGGGWGKKGERKGDGGRFKEFLVSVRGSRLRKKGKDEGVWVRMKRQGRFFLRWVRKVKRGT